LTRSLKPIEGGRLAGLPRMGEKQIEKLRKGSTTTGAALDGTAST